MNNGVKVWFFAVNAARRLGLTQVSPNEWKGWLYGAETDDEHIVRIKVTHAHGVRIQVGETFRAFLDLDYDERGRIEPMNPVSGPSAYKDSMIVILARIATR